MHLMVWKPWGVQIDCVHSQQSGRADGDWLRPSYV
jgi:hypothetical protein